MSTVAAGTEYEDFVAQVYTAILCAEQRDNRIRQITLEKKKRIVGAGGNPNEIDIYWEYEIAGITYKTAIECKGYSTSTVPVGNVRDFAYKLNDIGGIKGLFVTLNGYQSGSEIVARNENIDLLIIRKPKPADWDGYIQNIEINMIALLPARALDVMPEFDKDWMISQGYKEGDSFSYTCANNELFIEDKSTGFKKSLYELENENFDNKAFGEHVWEKSLADGWFHVPARSLKIRAIKIKYAMPSPIENKMEIDMTDHVLAILEYVNKSVDGSKRFAIGKDGQKKAWDEEHGISDV